MILYEGGISKLTENQLNKIIIRQHYQILKSYYYACLDFRSNLLLCFDILYRLDICTYIDIRLIKVTTRRAKPHSKDELSAQR